MKQEIKAYIKKLKPRTLNLFMAVVFLLTNLPGLAIDPNTLPTGQDVVSGSVNFSQNGNILDVRSNSTRSIVNYQSFNVGSNAIVNFHLVSPLAAILNRVTGGNPSQIFGTINSDGRVFLINPNGILFGAGSNVNVGSLFASTLDISNENFLVDNYLFQRNGANADITNLGTITTKDGGVLNLFASRIQNNGNLFATNGQINLAVGDTINFFNNGVNYQVVVTKELSERLNDFSDAIQNNGTIQINGGLVSLSVGLEDAIYDLAVNNQGIIEANNLGAFGGSVFLHGDGRIQNDNKVTSGSFLSIDTESLENNGELKAGDNLQILLEKHLFNTGNIEGQNFNIQSETLRNYGRIFAHTNGFLKNFGTETITRDNPDQSLIHHPFGGQAPSERNPNQTIEYSLLNESQTPDEKASIEAGNDLTIESGKVYNTSADMKAGNDLNIQADLLINERKGFRTRYIAPTSGNNRPSPWIEGLFEENDDGDTYAYFIDEKGDYSEGYLGADNDINLLVTDTINKDSIIEAGNDLNVEGNNFTNTAKTLLGTQFHTWRFGGRSYYEPAGPLKNETNFSNVTAVRDINFDLENDFNQASILEAGGDVTVAAENANLGLFTNFPTPPSNIIPARLFLPAFADAPDLNFDWVKTNQERVVAAFRSTLFNLYGKTYIGDEVQTAANNLEKLLLAAEALMNSDSSFIWGQALSDEQIENLIEPILWMEVGDDGKGRLVVYVPESFRATTTPEGLIQADSINFDLRDKFHNTGTVIADGGLGVKAKEIVNEQRTVKRAKVVRENKGMFKADKKLVFYDELQQGGNLYGNNITLEATDSITNKGGLVQANENLSLTAPEITNEVQEGTRVVVFDTGSLGELVGLKNWDLASEFEAGELKGNTVNIDSDTFKNVGSDVIGKEKVQIDTEIFTEQTWKTSYNTYSDKISFDGFGFKRNKQTEHVTRSSRIEAESGNVDINAGQRFTNVASDVFADGDINIKANEVEITDDIVQSTNEYDSIGIGFQAPSVVSVDFQSTDQTVTTQRGSNLGANGSINIDTTGNTSIIGSNLSAGEEINVNATDINIEAGKYTDTTSTTGGSIFTGLGPGTVTVGVNGYVSEGSTETVTPSQVFANEINLNANNNLNIDASNIGAGQSIDLTAPNVNIGGEYAYSGSETTFAGANATFAPSGIVGGGVNGGTSESSSGVYHFSHLTAPEVNIDSPNQNIDGANINGNEINPSNNQSFDNGSSSVNFGIGVGPGTVSLSGGFDDFQFSGGGGPDSGFFSVGYDNFSIGSGIANGPDGSLSGNIFGGAYGIGANFGGTTNVPGIENDHPIWNAGISYGPVAINGQFQHGILRQVGGVAGFSEFTSQINDWDYVCFVAGTLITMADGRLKAIEKIEAGEKVLSWNEKTKTNEIKTVLKAFRKQTQRIVEIQLENKLIEATPDHPFYVPNRGWIEAGKLNTNDKLFDEDGDLISIQSIKTINRQAPVYNLEIEGTHTYYAHGVLVHNINCDAEVSGKKYEIIDGNRVVDESGRELSPVEVYELAKPGLGSSLTDDQYGLASTIDRTELFELLEYFSEVENDPFGFDKKIVLVAINNDIKQSGNPLTSEQTTTFTNAAIAADLSYLAAGIAIVGAPVGGGTSANSAYQIAKSGGRHSGTYKQALKMNNKQLEKSIHSLDRQIKVHRDKINNPTKYYKDFYKLRPERQEANLTKHWPDEIKQFTEQKNILENVLKQRLVK